MFSLAFRFRMLPASTPQHAIKAQHRFGRKLVRFYEIRTVLVSVIALFSSTTKRACAFGVMR
jgi:hypothetical protein